MAGQANGGRRAGDDARLVAVARVLCAGCVVVGAGLFIWSADQRSRVDASRPRPYRVDINRADVPELSQLPGFGRELARSVIRAREKLGGFERVDRLLFASGVSAAMLERVRPLVTVGPREGENGPSGR